MSGDVSFLNGLVTALRADTGAGSLVELTGHTSADVRISRGKPPKEGTLPYLSVNHYSSSPLIKDHTQIKRYIVSIVAYAGKDITAIQIADRVEYLFHNIGGNNSQYFDFSNSDITIYSTLWKARVKAVRDEDTDSYADENIIEIISNPFHGH